MRLRAQRTLLESAARTATTTTIQLSDVAAHTVRLYLNVTGASGTGGLTLQLRGYDRASENTLAYVIFADGSAITATGQYLFELGPAIAAADAHRRATLDTFLPVVWDVHIVHGDGSSYTYSLSAETTS